VLIFLSEILFAPAQYPFSAVATAYSVYAQLPLRSEDRLLCSQPVDTPFCGERDPLSQL